MKRYLLLGLSIFLGMALIQGCGPIDGLSDQANDLTKNIVITPDSTAKIDTSAIKNLVSQAIDTENWLQIYVNATPDTLYLVMNTDQTWGSVFAQIQYHGNTVTNVTHEVYWPVSAAGSDFYPSCPDSSVETYWTTECSTIQTAVQAINNNNTNAYDRGYVTTSAIGSGESLTNVNNYLSCSGLKVWGRVGHGRQEVLQLTGGQMLSSFSMSLDGHGIYANSCKAYNDPFKSKVMNAGAEWFVSGIGDLRIGPSEEVFECTMKKALSQANVCSSLNSCMQSNAGKHGCGGPNQVIPSPTVCTEWSDCKNEDMCAYTGIQKRECSLTSQQWTETRECTRNTDGKICGEILYGPYGEWIDNSCRLTRDRECTINKCVQGSCKEIKHTETTYFGSCSYIGKDCCQCKTGHKICVSSMTECHMFCVIY